MAAHLRHWQGVALLLLLSLHAGAAHTGATVLEHRPAPPHANVEHTLERTSTGDVHTPPDRTLVNTYWKLVELDGAPVTVASGQREPHLVLQLQENRVVGSGGCNRLSGTYAVHGDFVEFRNVAATEKACAGGMAQEAAFLRTLGQVSWWRVRGDRLALLDGANAMLLVFVAVDLR
jgi:heat shock protein HslJ